MTLKLRTFFFHNFRIDSISLAVSFLWIFYVLLFYFSFIINDENCLLFFSLYIFAINPWNNWEPKAKVVFAYLNDCKVHSWETGLEGERCIRETAWANSPTWADFCELSDGVWLSTNATVHCTCPLSEVTITHWSGGTASPLQIESSMAQVVDWVSLLVPPLKQHISSTADIRSNYATTTFEGTLVPPCLLSSGSRSN